MKSWLNSIIGNRGLLAIDLSMEGHSAYVIDLGSYSKSARILQSELEVIRVCLLLISTLHFRFTIFRSIQYLHSWQQFGIIICHPPSGSFQMSIIAAVQKKKKKRLTLPKLYCWLPGSIMSHYGFEDCQSPDLAREFIYDDYLFIMMTISHPV